MKKPIQTGLAAYGMSGRVFMGPLLGANRHFKVSGILERTKTDSREHFPEAKIYRTFEDLCRDPELELVIINTPDHLHYDMARKALECGKHVVVEKPFTQTHEQAENLISLAKEKGRLLTVFHNRRWDNDFLTVRQVLDQGWLGKLVSFESHFDRFRNFLKENSWKEDPGTGSGTLFDLGSHLIDQALVLFGKPRLVTADIRSLREGSRVDDAFDLWLDYPDIKVKLSGSYLVKEQGPRYILHGQEGSFLKWGTDPQEEALSEGKKPGGKAWGKENKKHWGLLHTTIDGKALRERLPGAHGNYPAFFDNLYKAIRLGEPLAIGPEEAAMVVRVIEAAYESSDTKKSVKV
jgi:scyllo-inositol 2-dehydrogenase (NADP+)